MYTHIYGDEERGREETYPLLSRSCHHGFGDEEKGGKKHRERVLIYTVTKRTEGKKHRERVLRYVDWKVNFRSSRHGNLGGEARGRSFTKNM